MPLPRVQRIITDFERAVFVAVKQVFPNCIHLGCNFHWTQAVMKKVKDLKLATDYSKKGSNPKRDFISRLLCLSYLPGKTV